MADSYPGDILVAGGGFLKMLPVTLSGNDITAFGTALSFLFVSGTEKAKYANARKETEYLTKRSTTGVDLRVAKSSKTINAVDGSEAAAGDNADEISGEISMGKTDADTFISWLQDADNCVAACKGIGRRASDGAIVGFEHLIGYISGDFQEDIGEDIVTFNVTVKGGVAFTSTALFSAYNTAMQGATITPIGRTAITIKALVTGDYTNLITGKIVRTALS